jgi:hypothetical protein
MTGWRRQLLYTRQCVKTTWKLRLGVLVIAALTLASTSRIWMGAIARSLVCAQDVTPSDLILIENFDPNYLLFERAAALQKDRIAPQVLVPVQAWQDSGMPNYISQAVAEVMVRHARMAAWELLPISEVEPISLNAAFQIRQYLLRKNVKSLIVVTGGFRSQRSSLIYRTVLAGRGVQVRCDPVFGRATPERWGNSWHGIQGVAEEFVKLQYYRFYVLLSMQPTRESKRGLE